LVSFIAAISINPTKADRFACPKADGAPFGCTNPLLPCWQSLPPRVVKLKGAATLTTCLEMARHLHLLIKV
jgi:hypothetical protein